MLRVTYLVKTGSIYIGCWETRQEACDQAKLEAPRRFEPVEVHRHEEWINAGYKPNTSEVLDIFYSHPGGSRSTYTD